MADAIPKFFVYGEPDRAIDIGFVHVETVMARRSVHHGHVRAHVHDRMGQITFWTSGGGRYLIDDRVLDFSAPAVSFVPSRVVHGFDVSSGSDAIVVSIADGALSDIASLARLQVDAPVMLNADHEDPSWRRLRRLMDMILETYEDAARDSEIAISSLAAAVLVEMRRLSTADANPDLSTSLAVGLRRLVDRHFRQNWPIDRYASTLNVTPYVLGQACKKAFGVPVKELVNERRLLEAKRLLLFTVRSLEDIAFEVGLPDASYFSRFFSHHAGDAPSRWRRLQLARMGHRVSKPQRRK